ncbi:hypothetical protein [Peribacillus glennii]|uniref:hypothetical protein n=1 Tax=Peribacillus glennii TaxID=2303991 RepID=UPI0013144DB9|nr:hypothetical protein [Peribacillus glennii]
MDTKLMDFGLITRALYTSYESIKLDGDDKNSIAQLMDAEKNLFQALSFHLQRDYGKDD